MPTFPPIFGAKPQNVALGVVETKCVLRFPESATRPPIWEGYGEFHDAVTKAACAGTISIGGEFVTQQDDPDAAVVLLETPPTPEKRPEAHSKTIEWVQDPRRQELSCHFYVVEGVPENDPAFPVVEGIRGELFEELRRQPDGTLRGYPVVELFKP